MLTRDECLLLVDAFRDTVERWGIEEKDHPRVWAWLTDWPEHHFHPPQVCSAQWTELDWIRSASFQWEPAYAPPVTP